MASDIKVNNIKSYTGNTLNLGDTGDTINLTGASFNGTSSIIWDTTPKTSAFTATAGSGFFVDTSSAAITATLPASPSAGDIVAFKDYAESFATNNLTIARNGSNIQGGANDATLDTNRASVILVYVDATKGWLFTVESNVDNLTATVPDAPTIGTATATGQTTATVTFTAPSNDGGAPITQYTATSSPDGITGTLNQAGSGTITVSGLTKETSYTFTVTATNSVGTSAASAASNSITTPGDFVAATGGTVTTSGDFKIHTFTSSGTFTVTSSGGPAGSTTVDYLVVAGGGSGSPGGGSNPSFPASNGAGGGAGGYRESFPNPATGGFPISVQAYPITVGGGGAGSTAGNADGSNSVFSSITSAGGGAGGFPNDSPGNDGGSGGGGAGINPGPLAGGSGNTPAVSPPQGNDGGDGGGFFGGGGGGGASAAGTNGSPTVAGSGGNGSSSSITGSSVARGGGGGGSAPNTGTGGSGGGGDGQAGPLGGDPGTANTGGGGGGCGGSRAGGSGGSGIVVIRYKFQ